jgi:uncharacterized protein with von Willebrand factor type A (vWA) domain
MNQVRTHSIESDAYDRSAFAALKADSPSLQAVETSGGRLLPHFDGFLLDLFALLFKLNVVLHDACDVAPSAGFYRVLLDHIRASPALDVVRRHTVLDETTAGLATLLLAERLLDLLKSERLLTRAEMLDFWNLRQREEEIAGQGAEAQTAEQLQHEVKGRAAERLLGELRNRLRRDEQAGQRRLAQQARQVRSGFAEAAERERARVQAQLHHVADELETAREECESWSVHLGGGTRSAPGAQIELGHRLARNPKLRRMAQLVGRMRESARALRANWYERGNSDLHEVGIGAELSHLLPPEVLGLRHPVLRRDFARRLLDRALLVYALRARTEHGRGPMIVCLDGSSSMAGDKEIWSKAVTLTLLDIARRQRRRFRWICFASAETPLAVHDLNPGQPYDTDLPEVFEIAEYFPGGGTDFQKPLEAALECLRRAKHKRGDVVFITDGECRVDPEWLDGFKRAKAALGFSLFSVLIDVGSSSLGALKDLSDKITSVTQLTSEASRDVFLKV